MKKTAIENVVHTTFSNDLLEWGELFYRAKLTEGLSKYTLAFYRQQLGHFFRFCEWQQLTSIDQVGAAQLRDFLAWHAETGHNPGGQHAAYRVVKLFLRWYENEAEPEGWRNPISKVKAPKVGLEPLSPVTDAAVTALLETCTGGCFFAIRDRAAILLLLDTGARAREVTRLDTVDINPITGAVLIRQGKGSKPRTVFLGKTARRVMRLYLKYRLEQVPALFVNDEGERLTYAGLRGIITRRAKLAGIDAPTLHSFRRAWALSMLRAGVDVFTLQKLGGWKSLTVMRRYLDQDDTDSRRAYEAGSPADRINGK